MSTINSSNITSNTTNITESTIVNSINSADCVWLLASTALVFLMIPGVGIFYSGFVRSKNKLSLLLSSALATAIVSIQWYLWSYSLVFSTKGSLFIGNLDKVFMWNVGNKPSELVPNIPENLFMIYQSMFAAVTAAIAFGSAAERCTIRSFVVFLVFWTLLVYNFVAYWVWGFNGWIKKLGALDFAGGTPVHIVSGFSSLAYAIAVGPREGFPQKKFQPVNIADVFLGTILLWFGWFGFNAGSEFAINSRAVNAFIVSNIAASVAGLFWIITEMVIKKNKRTSLFGLCSGAIAGLVSITPAAGYVSPSSSLVFGVAAGILCCLACELKHICRFKYDDVCDVFAVHAIGGIIGGILTGFFADNAIVTMSGEPDIPGGWLNKNFYQILPQIAGIAAGSIWAFLVTFIIVKVIDLVPFLKLRVDKKEEEVGIDWTELGERAYGHDIEDSENL